MTNEAREERIFIKDRQISILDDMLEVIGYMKRHRPTLHPDEMERCWLTLEALNAEYEALGEQLDLAIFGEVIRCR